MHVPAWPVLPDQTIAQPVSAAFHVPALAGLGSVVCDESGCYDDGTPSGDSTTTIDFPFIDEPAIDLSTIPGTPTGTVVNVPNRAGGTSSVVNRGTQSQPSYALILGAATRGAFDIARLLAIQPGTLQQGNMITRQTPGFPVSAPSTSTNLGVQASTGGSLLIAAAVGFAAVLMFMGRK